MKPANLSRLGFSEAPPAISEPETDTVDPIGGPGCPLPLWIQYPTNSASQGHLVNCLAWWLITTKTNAQLASFIEGMNGRPNQQDALTLAIQRCRAWIWLHRYSSADIRAALENMTDTDAKPLRRELNTVRALMKSHTEGDTYE